MSPETSDVQPPIPGPRSAPGPAVNGHRVGVFVIVVVTIAGLVVSLPLFGMVLVWAYGTTLFGETVPAGDRAIGMLASVLCGPTVCAGPLLAGWSRGNETVWQIASAVAFVISAVVVALTW